MMRIYKYFRVILSFIFLISCLPIYDVHAQEVSLPFMPAPGTMVHVSPKFVPPALKGIKVYPENHFKFNFILDKGPSALLDDEIKFESEKLIKYFMAGLTVPEKDLWVNLSPYEHERIVPDSFGQTDMGRDLLAQDYLLKQLTSSLMYPEDKVGQEFWKKIYEESAKKFGTTHIPVNTFNKVWIVPDKAVVYENAKAGTAYVVESKLKVMMEQDYLAMQRHEAAGPAPAAPHPSSLSLRADKGSASGSTAALAAQIVREIIIPVLNKEVNEGKNFAQLRQVYSALILAAWYKKKIRNSVLREVYVDQKKTKGIDIQDPVKQTEGIYNQYLQAFKKGAYNYIKEEQDPVTRQMIPRKYFSGGVIFTFSSDSAMSFTNALPDSVFRGMRGYLFSLAVHIKGSLSPTIEKKASFNEAKNGLINYLRDNLGLEASTINDLLFSDEMVMMRALFNLKDKNNKNVQNVGLRGRSKDYLEIIASLTSSNNQSIVEVSNVAQAGDLQGIELMKKVKRLSELASFLMVPAVYKPSVTTSNVELIRRIIAAPQGQAFHEGDIYRDEMSEAVIKAVGKAVAGVGHREIFLDILMARLKAANRLMLENSNKREFDLFKFILYDGGIDNFTGSARSGTASTEVFKTHKRYGRLWDILDRSEILKEGVFEHLQEIGKTGKYYKQEIVRNIGGGIIIYNADSEIVPDIMQHLDSLWHKMLQNTAGSDVHRTLAEYEWWFFQANPLGRGGAALGDAMSIIAQIMIGAPLRGAYENVDFVALSMTLDDYIKARVDQLRTSETAETFKKAGDAGLFDKGGIDLQVDKINLDIKNNGQPINLNFNPAQLEQLRNAQGFSPIIMDLKPIDSLPAFLGATNSSAEPRTAGLNSI